MVTYTDRRWNLIRIALEVATLFAALVPLVVGLKNDQLFMAGGATVVVVRSLFMIPLRIWKHQGLPLEEGR